MSVAQATAADPHAVGHGSHHHHGSEDHDGGVAATAIVTSYGFWIFLVSDIIMFACFFAAYAVLEGATAGGPAGKDLFDLSTTAIETGCLLLSSFTSGLATVAAHAKRQGYFQAAMAVTFVLGAAFIAIEVHELSGLVAHGNGPDRSAFLSAFFALVGCHGLHVSLGLLWLLTMMAQVYAKGFRDDIERRITCFILFWHALDIIWVALFTNVYLIGSAV